MMVMIRSISFLILALGLFACGSERMPETPVEAQPVVMPNTDSLAGFYLIPQEGSPFENGFLHGSQLSAQILAQITTWEAALAEHMAIGPDSIEAIVFKHSGFVQAIEKHAPALLEEVRGIAEGAGISYERVLAYNVGEEVYNFANAPYAHCSTLAKVNPEEHLIAYNQDLPDFLRGEEIPVILQHDQYLIFSVPGYVATCGVSSTLAVSCNSLPMLRMNLEGLPLPFMIRMLLEQSTDGETAAALVQDIQLAIPQNLMLCSSQSIVNYELSASRIDTFGPMPQSGFMYHTNHPLINTEYENPDYEIPECPRYHFLDSVVVAYPQDAPCTADELARFMGEQQPQYPLDNAETFVRYIATFDKAGQAPTVVTVINPKRHHLSHTFQL